MHSGRVVCVLCITQNCVCVSSACVSIVWDQDTALCVLTVHYGTALPRAHTVEDSSEDAHHRPGAALRAPWPPLHGLTFECAMPMADIALVTLHSRPPIALANANAERGRLTCSSGEA